MSEWIKCSDRLPTECEDCLVYLETSGEVQLGFLFAGLWYLPSIDMEIVHSDEIIYWIPLPDCPYSNKKIE